MGKTIMAMTKKERAQIERLERLLDVERERAETAWENYRSALYELVDVKMKLEQVEKVLRGEYD
jgi:hypothetical protein